MRRKVTGLVMVLALALAFTACGGKDAEDVSGKITPVVNDEQGADDTDVTPTEAAKDEEPEATEEPKATEAPEATEEPKATEAPEETGKTTSLGRVQGGVYVNEYMGVSCALDSNWEFYTAEELQELPQNVEELFDGTAAEDMMSDLQIISDMVAENAEDLTTMNITYQKMSMQERLAFASLTNDDIVEGMVTSQKDMLIATYAQAGLNVQEMCKKTVTFCGEERDAVYTACDANGVAYYALQLLDYSLGDYAVTLTVTSFVEDKTEELLTLFTKYE